MKQPCTCSVTPTHASTPDAHSLPPPWTPMPTRRASRCVSFALGLALGTVRRSCDVVKALGGGLLGTLLQTLMVYGVVPVLAGQSIPVAVLREHACAPGMLAHLLSGGVLFPLGYLWIASHAFSGPPVLQGMLWAGLLWAGAEVIMAPLLGAAVFSTALGGLPAALRARSGYLVYGATLGSIAGAMDRLRRHHRADGHQGRARDQSVGLAAP